MYKNLICFIFIYSSVSSLLSKVSLLKNKNSFKIRLLVTSNIEIILLNHHNVEKLLTNNNSFTENLIFIPGIDGIGDNSMSSIEKLTNFKKIYRVIVDKNDRSNFIEYAEKIITFLEKSSQPCVLIGTSFGALIALYVSI